MSLEALSTTHTKSPVASVVDAPAEHCDRVAEARRVLSVILTDKRVFDTRLVQPLSPDAEIAEQMLRDMQYEATHDSHGNPLQAVEPCTNRRGHAYVEESDEYAGVHYSHVHCKHCGASAPESLPDDQIVRLPLRLTRRTFL